MHFFYSISRLVFCCSGCGGYKWTKASLPPPCHQPVILSVLGSPDTVVFTFLDSLPLFPPRARVLNVFHSRRLPVNLSPWDLISFTYIKHVFLGEAVLILQNLQVSLLGSFLKSFACVSWWFLTLALQDCLGRCVVLVSYEIRCYF